MESRSAWFRGSLSGVTIGGSGGGQPLSLVILTIIVLAMALATVYDAVLGRNTGVDLTKKVPFKCTNAQCNPPQGTVQWYTIGELQKMMPTPGPGMPAGPGIPPGPGTTTGPGMPGGPMAGPMAGPMTLECPACHQKNLTQAVQCPKCGNIFVMQTDPAANKFDDSCPKCHESYAKAWQEKYRQSGGEE